MEQFVVVREDAPGRYTAQALGVPDIKAEGTTEAEAVERALQSLADWLASGKVEGKFGVECGDSFVAFVWGFLASLLPDAPAEQRNKSGEASPHSTPNRP